MKQVVLIVLFLIVVIVSSPALFCENILLLESRIPDKPYFMIGDIIYEVKLESQNSLDGSYNIRYRYVGFSGNSVSISSEYTADDALTKLDTSPVIQTINVPFDNQEKGYLLVPALPQARPEIKVLPLKLVIGVYDRQKALITVNEYGLKHTSARRSSASYVKPSASSSGQAQQQPQTQGVYW